MRACEGCRRRKIKCDAATNNSWPCAACVRLKLQCVRPVGYDGGTDGQGFDDGPIPQSGQQQPTLQPQPVIQQQQPQLHQQSQAHAQAQAQAMYNGPIDFQHQQLDPNAVANVQKQQQGIYGAQAINYAASSNGGSVNGLYNQIQQFPDHSPPALNYTTVPAPVIGVDPGYTGKQETYSTPSVPQSSHSQSSPSDSAYITNDDQAYANSDLADLLGTLKMNDAGSAPYLNNKMLAIKSANDEPVVGDDEDDYKSSLPPLVSRPGLKIRIPPELMPDDETIMSYFELYFIHVHPFVPVLDRNIFYEQWRSNREAISPLLIEALLAIGGRLADDPAQGQQWLALATRHADSFMDVPRLSTLQALLVMLKAREAAPKRGYYYRSWMAIVQCVQMGKDLGLDEHFADHEAGISCDSSPAECLMKTRIWQTIFICEVMIGSPQGRTDLSVSVDSININEPPPTPGVHEADMLVSRNFVYLTRIVRNVSIINRIYGRIKRNKDWAADPEFTKMNPQLLKWPNQLPADLSVSFPPDGTAPWIPNAFIGNAHSYYYLSILLLHRPQLQILSPTSPDGAWKEHMMVCYSSAKLLCRLEEAILDNFGLSGLQNMQRGINFTIYAILTCILVHLVALTSPDPDFNTDAREYFTRHMRILEKCMNAWPMTDMQRQIDSMREAFSADLRKPFVLKPSFPYGSPSPSAGHPSPPHQQLAGGTPTGNSLRADPMRSQSVDQIIQQHQQQQQHHQHHQFQQQQLGPALSQGHPAANFMGNPISPPVSVGTADIKTLDSPLSGGSLGLMSAVTEAQGQHMLSNNAMSAASGWNPNRIFENWNSTFGSAEIPSLQDIQAVHAGLATMNPIAMASYPTGGAAPVQQQTFITPAMWQESVASVYEGGLKRSWDYDH